MNMLLSAFVGLLLAIGRVTSEFKQLNLGQRSWRIFYSNSPEDFTPEAKTARFPHVYQMDNLSDRILDPPLNFSASVLARELVDRGAEAGRYYPGVSVSFTTPASASDGLRGFELRLDRISSELMLVLDFTGVTDIEEGVENTLDIFPLTGLANYRVQMTSLPLYDVTQQSTEEISVVTGIFGHNRFLEEQTSPSSWSAAMRYYVLPASLHDETRDVEVVFSRPPESFGFRRFELTLVPKDHTQPMQMVATDKFAHIFHGVKRGFYKLMLKPVDDFFSVYERCLCRLSTGPCTNCVTTMMETFYIG